MKEGYVEIVTGVAIHRGIPYIESRARPLGGGAAIPEGKILVTRAPILPPGASEAEIEQLTETVLIDDDGIPCPFCVRGDRPVGRNEPCPCGSGLKFKKCCLPSRGDTTGCH